MAKKVYWILALGLFIATASEVTAQGLGLGPLVGYHKTKDADDGQLMGGVALRAKLSPALGIEGSINYRQEKFADGDVTVRSWPLMVTGLIYPVPVAYGALGAGWYNTTIDVNSDLTDTEGDQTEQEFGWHFGGGVEVPVGASVKLTGDIRYVFLNYNFEAVPGSEVDSDFYVITAGLLFGL